MQRILISQTNDLTNSSKLQIFEKIDRFMPFDSFEFLHLRKLRDQLVAVEASSDHNILSTPAFKE